MANNTAYEAESTVGVGSQWRCQVKKEGENWLELVLNVHITFPYYHPNYFCHSSNQLKNIGRGAICPSITPCKLRVCIHLSVRLSIYLSIYPSFIHPSIYLSTFFIPPYFLPLYPSTVPKADASHSEAQYNYKLSATISRNSLCMLFLPLWPP